MCALHGENYQWGLQGPRDSKKQLKFHICMTRAGERYPGEDLGLIGYCLCLLILHVYPRVMTLMTFCSLAIRNRLQLQKACLLITKNILDE